MTAAVSGPSFRDQLAEALVRSGHLMFDGQRYKAADALLPLIAAEVEARVQAADNQRAAEELREAADAYQRGLRKDAPTVPMSLVEVAPWLRDRADAPDPS